MRAIFLPALIVAAFAGSAVRAADPIYTEQGAGWTQALRDDFPNRRTASHFSPTALHAMVICPIPPTITGFRSASSPRARAGSRSSA